MERRLNIQKWFYGVAILCMGFCVPVYSAPVNYSSAENNFGNSDDTLRDRAMVMLKEHMDDLRNLTSRQFAFKAGYVNPNPTVPCDYCAGTKDIKLDDYVVDISNRFENFDFTYQITDAYDDIRVVTNQKGDYEVVINVKKTVRGLLEDDNTVNKKKRKTSFLTYRFTLNYIKGIYGISEITAKEAPGADAWMVELNPNIMLTKPDFGSQQVYALSSSSAFLTKLGVVKYFNPFSGLNPANIWLKAGARINLLTSKIQSDFVDFTESEVPLDGGTETNPHEIDIRRDLTDVTEKQTSLLVEIPVGFSKRFRLSNTSELSLELEVSYSFLLFSNYKSTYRLDQIGTNHLLNSDIQSQSGGSPVTYDAAQEVVLSADGELINFFRDQTQEIEPDKSDNSGYLTFSFRPTVMIKKFESLRYNIGLNVSYRGVNNDPFQLDYSYFNGGNTENRKPVHDADEAKSRIFAGLIFGIKF